MATYDGSGTGTGNVADPNCPKNPLLDHVGITVSDYAKAKEFYTTIIEAVGGKLHMEIAPPHTPEGKYVAGYGYSTPDFWITNCGNEHMAPTHFAFSCDTRAQVDKWYEAALAAGAKDNGKPGIRAQYHPNYYGAFVIDADGHRIEAVCHKAE